MNRRCINCNKNAFVSTAEVNRNEVPNIVLDLMYGGPKRKLKFPKPWWFCTNCHYCGTVDRFNIDLKIKERKELEQLERHIRSIQKNKKNSNNKVQ